MSQNPTSTQDDSFARFVENMHCRLKAHARAVRRTLKNRPNRFRGPFATREDAALAVPAETPVGYDNDEVTEVSYKRLCQLEPWDKPVVKWLQWLAPRRVLDAGGHMGTKYRAFRPHLDLDRVEWTVYDVPAIVRAGRERAQQDGLTKLKFSNDLAQAPAAEVLLASGMLPYLDEPLSAFLSRLPNRPNFLLLNKVATHRGPDVYLLENFGVAEVPYLVRNQADFESTLLSHGYALEETWNIDPLSHLIPGGGWCSYRGYAARLIATS